MTPPPPAPRPSATAGRTALAGVLLLLLAGCAGAGRPDPVAVDPPAPIPDTAEEAGVDRPALRPVGPPDPPRPWLPPALSWRPSEPREGDVVAVHLRQPEAGRRPTAVEGELDGRPVRFARLGDRWFGVASAPIGSAGRASLELRFRLAPDSMVVRRTELRIAERTFPATRLSVDPRFSSPSTEALVRIREERKLVTAVLARTTDDWLPRGPFERPRGTRVTSPFGQRRVFNDELRSRHTGVDLAGGTGAPVRAPARGRVALARELYYAGNAVYLDHGLGLYTGYFHLSDITVREGDTLRAGELVGRVGDTGRVTGPHLHWAAWVHGEPLDARSLLELEPPVPAGPAVGGAGDGVAAPASVLPTLGPAANLPAVPIPRPTPRPRRPTRGDP